jgi:hypothetical protein
VSEQLGGIERINLQMTNPRLRHADLLHSIELLGTGVVPLVKAAASGVWSGVREPSGRTGRG